MYSNLLKVVFFVLNAKSLKISATFVLFQYKIRLRNMLWCHNSICIAWYKHGNWPITVCIRHNLLYKNTQYIQYSTVFLYILYKYRKHRLRMIPFSSVTTIDFRYTISTDGHWWLGFLRIGIFSFTLINILSWRI